MSFTKISVLAGAVALVSRVAAHGTVDGITADGVFYQGYSPSFQFASPEPVVIGWSIPQDLDNGFVPPSSYTDSDIICHKGATNAKASAKVTAGSIVDLHWTTWPESHHGPMIDYLASCNGDCTTVDKTTLKFFKIDGVGLIDGSAAPGKWASDQMIANNSTWSVTIPSDIAPGNYVLRHETIALHSADKQGGAQNYPQCINLEITGSGTATPAGVLATALYTPTDAGIFQDIYNAPISYVVPGPAVYSSGSAPVDGTAPAASSVAVSSAAASTVAASTAAAVEPVATDSEAAPAAPTTIPEITSATGAIPTFTTLPRPSSGFSGFTNATRTCRTGHATHTPKPVTTSSSPVSLVSPILSPSSVVNTALEVSTTAPFVEIGAPTSAPSSVPTAGTTSPVDLPAGTTLNDVLSWLSSFFGKYGKGEYTGATVARRHARDVSA